MKNEFINLQLMVRDACKSGVFDDKMREKLIKKAQQIDYSENQLNELINRELELINQEKASGFITEEEANNNDLGSGFVTEQVNQNLHDKTSDNEFSEVSLLRTTGAMSEIYSALYLGTRKVIIKRIKKEFRENSAYRDLFYKEFSNAFILEHQHIARVYGKGEDQDGPYYFMEYIDGRTLTEYIKETPKKKESDIQRIFIQLLDALIYIHKKQIFHRDLKPDNILVTYKGDNVKIIDFGLANADSFDDFLKVVGTKKYAAPEQKKDAKYTSHLSDIYSIGLILLEMLTNSIDLVNLPKVYNKIFTRIIVKATKTDPKERYQNCEEMKAEFSENKKYSTVPEWLEKRVVEFASDGIISKSESKMLEIEASKNGIDKQILHALIDVELEKARNKIAKEKLNKRIQSQTIKATKPKSTKKRRKPTRAPRKKFERVLFFIVIIIILGIVVKYSNIGDYVNKNIFQIYKENPLHQEKMYVNARSLNLRKLASESAEILDSYPKGTEVMILDKYNYWARVQIGDKKGYMSLKYLSNKKP